MNKVGVGGTFNVLHRGHRALLDKAFEVGDEVAIGVMSDAYAAKSKKQLVPLDQRLSALRSYLSSKVKPFTINVIEDAAGNLLSDPALNALVVSPESFTAAERLSKVRAERGLGELRLHRIGYVLADDCTPISSSRVLEGEIDLEGRMLRAMRACVGSDNPVKLQAATNVLARIYGNVEVTGHRVSVNVPSEPWGEDVERGAVERARKVLGSADFGIGIEAGIFERKGDLYDVQYCAVVDKMNRVTVGHGSGFKYPSQVSELLRKGATVGEAFKQLYDLEKSGRGNGAIGFLTHGMLKRSELTEQAVVAAMVPRMRKELYFEA
ncbi:MAG: inosine/xanthosine triphosphatase [Methanomassiliicoccales archaeon]|jgi:inosine/xanthosine triphosphatase|nr:inosine/xanthosine triphosphatase [Methanomassiliicoccales archaeon]